MIFSKEHKLLIVSPHKTGTRYRLLYYHSVNNLKQTSKNTHSTFNQFVKSELYNDSINSFCFVRNPWDRIISIFNDYTINDGMQNKKSKIKPFIMLNSIPSMDSFYTSSEAGKVNHLLPFEDLNQSIQKINNTVNLNHKPVDLKPFKNYDLYKEWFDVEMIQCIAEKEKRTLNLIDYKFNLN